MWCLEMELTQDDIIALTQQDFRSFLGDIQGDLMFQRRQRLVAALQYQAEPVRTPPRQAPESHKLSTPPTDQKKGFLREEIICEKACNIYQIGGNLSQPYGQSYTIAIEKTDTSAIQDKIAQGIMWEFHLIMAAHEYIRPGSLVSSIIAFRMIMMSSYTTGIGYWCKHWNDLDSYGTLGCWQRFCT
jgi:hypothetical protein